MSDQDRDRLAENDEGEGAETADDVEAHRLAANDEDGGDDVEAHRLA